jgi:hypothetical protein
MPHHPPSLPPAVLARAFVDLDGALGLVPADAPAFLEACKTDRLTPLAWEVWLIDHSDGPVSVPGSWTGLIPMADGTTAVVGGAGNPHQIRTQIARWKPQAEVAATWLPFVRINIALSDDSDETRQ